MSSILNQPLTKFQVDVRAGLLTQPKTLPSKYFYDERGDELFARIMRLPEYYLTGCETEILHAYAESILSETGYGQEQFEILELGAGNGLKTRILLEAATGRGLNFTYLPVDISADSLEQARANILATVPACAVTAYVLDYTDTALLPETDCPRLWLFLGSNLGNYDFSEAVDFLGRLTRRMGSRDTLLLGLDLHKDREIILPAYNDSAGVTAEFNLNLLRRMNYEWRDEFRPNAFRARAAVQLAPAPRRKLSAESIATAGGFGIARTGYCLRGERGYPNGNFSKIHSRERRLAPNPSRITASKYLP